MDATCLSTCVLHGCYMAATWLLLVRYLSFTRLLYACQVIATLGLDGGFQDFYLRLGGSAFGSRTPISAHPHWAQLVSGQCSLLLERIGDRPKAVGMT